ncbi:MAG: tRNA (adenosine(37)-N6)-threonylcarbamoyltransferase complex ATPase subunit type 1 TsaE, partial [Planctomycetes bacterium]|nr:tRNA (adenosine(37)-N6)-threonylcarbamoyltransferase complex ATPase subunit type 1 TsaE [Planctomycetota bacterium]
MEVQLLTDGVEGTLALGAIIAASSPLPLIVKLSGQLGGGKTHLVKGLAQALCGTSPMHVTSPTFTLLHSYRGRGATLHHLDLYRVESA